MDFNNIDLVGNNDLQPYQDEPLADEQWILEYEKGQIQLERNQTSQLQIRLCSESSGKSLKEHDVCSIKKN